MLLSSSHSASSIQKIDLETIRVRGADANYSAPADLRQMYNDLKAYVGRENAEDKLL